MIKFSEIAEASEKTDVSEKYKNIKPTEKMTDKEADDFWASEFEKTQDEGEVDPYDRLLSESFNRSEDEINIDFDFDDKLLAILEKFKPENWSNLSESEQISSLKELAGKIGERLGLDKIPSISIFEDERGAYGDYDPVNNTVKPT